MMMINNSTIAHPDARSGRGALSNASSRFDRQTRVNFDDGWDTVEQAPAKLRTSLAKDTTRSIISRNSSPDLGFDRSINPYRGCEHGCSYCFARPSHAFLGLSPGLDFETKLFYKPRAAELLRKELSRPGYDCQPIALGTNTDPYQPVERKLKLTRSLLEVMSEFNHPVSIVTKSDLVLRDLDILSSLADRRLIKVAVSITTLDRVLARRMEPRAATPAKRLEAVEKLAAAGIPTGVMAAPMIPALNDPELERILEASAWAGARTAGYILLRLPLEIGELWRQWLEENYPERAKRVMRLLRGARGGKDYDARFGYRMSGEGPYAKLIKRRFDLACNRLGLIQAKHDGLDVGQFTPPPPPEAETRQLSLL